MLSGQTSIKESIFRVVDELGFHGTAFAASARFIVTVDHLAGNGIVLVSAAGSDVRATLIARFPQDDLAFFRPEQDVCPLPLSEGASSSGVMSFGFPPVPTVNGFWARGVITGETSVGGEARIQIESDSITLGFSGAPLCEPSGAVVGVVSTIMSADQLVQGRLSTVAFAIPSRIVLKRLQELGAPFEHAAPADPNVSIARVEALQQIDRSRGRCYARWRAVVSEAIAREFTDDDRLDLFPDVSETLERGGLSIVLGEFGSGKSLGLERALQRVAQNIIDRGDCRRIIYYDARDGLAEALFSLSTLSPDGAPFALFVDNAEATGALNATRLLETLRALRFVAPTSSIVMTARPSATLLTVAEATVMPPLPISDALRIASRVAPDANLRGLAEQQPALLERPLFVLLAAQYYTERPGVRVSQGDLLTFLAERELTRLQTVSADVPSLLRRLASRQTDAGGSVVPISSVASTADRGALLDSGLVTYDTANKTVGFTLPILTQWLAAQSIELGEVDVNQFVGQEMRFEAWREALMLRVGTASDEEVDVLFEALVSMSPGFAASLAHDTVPSWFAERDQPRPSPLAYAGRLRSAMSAWLVALGPLAAKSPFADDLGTYAVGARIDDAGRLTTAWRTSREGSETFELPETFSLLESSPHVSRSSSHRLIDLRPAWNWTSSCIDVGKFLKGVFQWHEYASAPAAISGRQITFPTTVHEHELAWQAALGALAHGSLSRDPLLLTDIVRSGCLQSDVVAAFGARYFSTQPLRSVVSRLGQEGRQFLEPPWPVQESPMRRWVWGGYEEETLLRRVQVVHHGALELYELIVRSLFGRFASRMPLMAAMPFDLRINVTSLGQDDGYSPPIGEWSIAPLEKGSNVVTVFRGEPAPLSAMRDAYWAAVTIRPEIGKYAAFPSVRGQLMGFNDLPITEIAYRWLNDDIASLFG